LLISSRLGGHGPEDPPQSLPAGLGRFDEVTGTGAPANAGHRQECLYCGTDILVCVFAAKISRITSKKETADPSVSISYRDRWANRSIRHAMMTTSTSLVQTPLEAPETTARFSQGHTAGQSGENRWVGLFGFQPVRGTHRSEICVPHAPGQRSLTT
jgi:hypothetical protein